MNYDSITGLPLKESFLAYTTRAIQEKNPSYLFIMAIRFPILSHTVFLLKEQNRNYLLSSSVHKLIRGNHFIKTAYRMDDDTLITLIDKSALYSDQMDDELTRAFSLFSEESAKSFDGTRIAIHGGLCQMQQESDIETCISNACQILSSISDQNKTCFVYFHDNATDKENLESSIIPAIEESWKSNHILVYLQPKFDLYNMTLAGAEALVRIIDMNGHMLKPSSIFPVLEKHELACEMDLMVTEKILRLMLNWHEHGITPIPISVNLSERTLYDPLFEDIFSQLIEKYETVSRYLRIEISEACYLRNPYHINQMISNFHNAGCLVELDDFGKAMMSYSFQTIPNVDFVKLSPTFWTLAMKHAEYEDSFEESLEMLGDHSISCISECVERESEIAFLKAHHIHYAQGFYFSRPVPFDIFQKKYLTYTFVPSL